MDRNKTKIPVRARDKTHFWSWDKTEETGIRSFISTARLRTKAVGRRCHTAKVQG